MAQTDVVLWVRFAAFAYTRSEFPMFLISLVSARNAAEDGELCGLCSESSRQCLLFV